jgi:hydroxymethylpyrimidine pyrophosphatase-like HAD family hydrolase
MDLCKTSIVFHDLDGCINPGNGEDYSSGEQATLSDNQYAVLDRLANAIDRSPLSQFVINTGRGIADTHFIAKEIKSDKFRYCLLEHSGYAWDMHNDHKVHLTEIAKEIGDTEYLEKYKGMKQILELIDWFLTEGGKKFEKEEGIQLTFLEKEANVSILTPKNVTPDSIIDRLSHFISQYFPKTDFVYCYSHAYIDVLCDIHKSDGAKLLCKYLDIDINESYIVGDGMNDLDIFSTFPNLMCPKNAHPHLQGLCVKNGGYVSDHKYCDATFDLLGRIT